MIVFKGTISETTEKHLIKKDGKADQIFYSIGMIIFFPVIVLTVLKVPGWFPIIAYGVAIAMIPVLPYLPRSQKRINLLKPKRIYVDGEYIICILNNRTESRLIHHVKAVYDCGEYYDIVFPLFVKKICL